MVHATPPAAGRWLAGIAASLLLAGCGGGGGGGGGSDPPPVADGSVTFAGFTFRSGSGQQTSTPPFESSTSKPPTLGAPLNVTIIFHFSGVPEGPFDLTTLPVFTTADEVTPLALASGAQSVIPAKGSWVPVGTTVEFRPFIPSAPLQVALSAPPAAVPGLLPGSIYTARVNDAAGAKLGNLVGSGGSVKFGTTSNPAAFFPAVPGDDDPPALVGSLPADGAQDFYPAAFSLFALGASAPTYPPGDEDLLLTYDRPLAPSEDNLFGQDSDGDGVREPTFVLRGGATAWIVAHEVPAGVLGSHPAFPALSGLHRDRRPALDGADVFLHGEPGPALPGGDPALSAVPAALCSGRDPSLLWVALPVANAPDRLAVVDHVAGSPAFARLSATALETGLEIGALQTLQDGRLIAYDKDSRRLVELLPQLVRHRPTVDAPAPGAPELLGVALGDGVSGFRSEPLSDPATTADPDVLDLAQAPSGELYALARLAGEPHPVLLRLSPIDVDLDGVFDPADGTFGGGPQDVVLRLEAEVSAVELLSETRLLVLNRSTDALEVFDLLTGARQSAVSGVGGFGLPPSAFPGGLGPAVGLALGHLDHELQVTLLANDEAGAVVRLAPAGLLPIDTEMTLLQRNTLRSLAGISEINANGQALHSPLGAVELLSLATAAPTAGALVPVDDAFFEDFLDDSLEDAQATSLSSAAEWAELQGSGQSSGGLRASVGVTETAQLGDFLPATPPGWDSTKAYVRKNFGESDMDKSVPGFRLVLLDTDAQNFPLSDGSTPGITAPITVKGGYFVFRDFIVPEGVRVWARGSRPLVITATRRFEVHGLLDVAGTDGFSEDAFDTSFLPVPAGPGGPGAGRGGDGHPTLFDPQGPGTLDQYVTPEQGERGWGPVVSAAGTVSFQRVGGHGGLSSAGYDPSANGFPKIPASDNNEFHRPPGGGGGSYFYRGSFAHEGAGTYLVQSNSTWAPFSKCPTNDKIHDALYGNDEKMAAGLPVQPLQCVYMLGTPQAPVRLVPGGAPGDLVFTDGDRENDFIGPGGELSVLVGGQGGGGGGSRVDSLRHTMWAVDVWGSPLPSPPAPPYYPKLIAGPTFFSPTMYDSKGGAGAGGGGALLVRCFGDILVSRTGHIDASGGHGGGGEQLSNSSFAAGGGGGSGGVIILQAAGQIRVEADSQHRTANFIDTTTAGEVFQGAALDVSGGMGRDARTSPQQSVQAAGFSYEATRGDGGQGGFGLIQLHAGGGPPQIDEGAFLFAGVRGELKQGPWSGNPADQKENPAYGPNSGLPDDLRYIDMLHYRSFSPFTGGFIQARDRYYVLNGSFPPIIPSPTGDNGQGPISEYPPGSGQRWFDTAMMQGALSQGLPVVQEPRPEWIFATYNGWNPTTFLELNYPASHPDFPGLPGDTYKDQVIPFSVDLIEPDGIPRRVLVDGQQVFDPTNVVDRLPVVPLERTPPPFGTTSRGTSRWLDFQGVALRARDGIGRPPPFFAPVHGTWNAGGGPVPAGSDGLVRLTGAVPIVGVSAHYVANAEPLVDPGLFGQGVLGGDPPYNDLKVDAPDPEVLLENVVTDNALVRLLFQGSYPLRPGSRVPDPETLSPWVADATSLSGYPLVRFQVVFDLGADPEAFPFGVDSLRPRVDWLRMRLRY